MDCPTRAHMASDSANVLCQNFSERLTSQSLLHDFKRTGARYSVGTSL